MKTLFKAFVAIGLALPALVIFSGCEDDEGPGPQLTGESTEYVLESVSDPSINGIVTFSERDDDQVVITIALDGTPSGGSHPAHIHASTAAEGGTIVLDLNPVNGADGKSETVVSALNDGTPLTYADLIEFDGHVNVHMSEADLGTLIAQGDIGQNALTGQNKVYTLTPVADPNVTGTATFAERMNGTTLVTVSLTGTQPGSEHNSHIHENTIADVGEAIVIDLNPVKDGMARTSVRQKRDGTPVTYQEMLDFNGYLNVHVGSSFVVQGDIGQNELTGETKEYVLSPVIDPQVTGKAIFAKRKNGQALVIIDLDNLSTGVMHSSHIHENTVADVGEAIVVDLNAVDGNTGRAETSVRKRRDGTPVTYDDLLDFNGYINVHSGSSFVVQGDIGQNELTGDKVEYPLGELNDSGVTGTALFEKRKNGKGLVTLRLTGTVAGGDHPAHIHANSAATDGSIVVDLTNVNGATGLSTTSVRTKKDGSAISYDELIIFNGHINVHKSPTELAIRIAQGDIGANAD